MESFKNEETEKLNPVKNVPSLGNIIKSKILNKKNSNSFIEKTAIKNDLNTKVTIDIEDPANIIKTIKSDGFKISLQQLQIDLDILKTSVIYMDSLNNIAKEQISNLKSLIKNQGITNEDYKNNKNKYDEILFKEQNFILDFQIYCKGFLDIIDSSSLYFMKNELGAQLNTEKFWIICITILEEVYKLDKLRGFILSFDQNKWNFFKEKFNIFLNMMKNCSLKTNIIQKYIDSEFGTLFPLENYSSLNELILEDFQNRIEESLNNINLELDLNKNSKRLKFILEILLKLQNISLSTDFSKKTLLIKSIKEGRLSKKNFELDHSLILGRDGGIYLLLNSVTDNEFEILIEKNPLLKDYFILKTKEKTESISKILIGKGTFGKIRIAIALTGTLKTTIGESKLLSGEIICLKKTNYHGEGQNDEQTTKSEIRANVLNDYISDIVGKNIHSPDIYDMNIINLTEKQNKTHCKGYTMQQFLTISDGSIFLKDSELQTWSHVGVYLLDIFTVIQELLNLGMAMTDLKPGNTLYDKENRIGKLIDLAGVVRKKNRAELEHCKIKYVKEFTQSFTCPKVMQATESGESDIIVDLCKAMSYSLGIIVKQLTNKILNPPNHSKINDLITNMTCHDPKLRWSVEQGLDTLKSIGGFSEVEINYQSLIDKLKEIIKEENFEVLGLKQNIQCIKQILIKTFVSGLDPDKFSSASFSEKLDINDSINEFLNNKEKVFLLMGTAGTGKSTLLQLKFLDLINNWNIGNPIPFYVNLASGTDLQEKWKSLIEKLKLNINFSVFVGSFKQSIILLLDSFDESRQKCNLVMKFLRDLGNNINLKMIFTCRTDYLSNEKDDLWFKISGNEDILPFKKYILPIDKYNFNLDDFISRYIEVIGKNINDYKLDDYVNQIEKFNLLDIIKTNSIAFMILEVLPYLQKDQNLNLITKFEIFNKYTDENIKKEIKKTPNPIINSIKAFFNDDNFDIFETINLFACELAKLLHFLNLTMVQTDLDNIETINFLNKFGYNNKKELKLQIFFNFMRILNLNFELQGERPFEKFNFSFPHDNIKNYFLIKVIINELKENELNDKTLGIRNIVSDENLINIFVEILCPDRFNLVKYLRKIVYNSKFSKDVSRINASANSITLLIASNVAFTRENLTGVNISGANISNGIFYNTDFSECDLSNVKLYNASLKNSKFYKTNMEKINFGVYPDLELEDKYVWSISLFDLKSDEKNENENEYFLIVTGCSDGMIRLYIFEEGLIKAIKTIKAHTNNVYSVCVSEDGNSILSGSEDKLIKLWKIESEDMIQIFQGHSFPVFSVSFSPLNDMILSGSMDKTIKLWDIISGLVIRTFLGHAQSVSCVLFSKNSDLIISSSGDRYKPIMLWKKDEEKNIGILDGHLNAVSSISISKDSNTLISGSWDKQLILWCLKSFKKLMTYKGHTDYVYSVCFSGDENIILSASKDKTIRLWEKMSGKTLQIYSEHLSSVLFVCLSVKNNIVLSASKDCTIRFREINTGLSAKKFEGHNFAVNRLDISLNNKYFVSCSNDQSIILWELESGKLLLHIFDENGIINGVCFSRDDKNIITTSKNRVIIWDLSGKMVKTLDSVHTENVTYVSCSYKGDIIVSASEDQSVIIWYPNNTNKRIAIHSAAVYSVCFSYDDKFILTASDDKTLQIINFPIIDNESPLIFNGHTGGVKYACFDSNGDRFLSASMDKTIRLWDRSLGNCIKIYEGHSDTVQSVAFSPNFKKIVSGSDDNTVRLWDLESGITLQLLSLHKNWVSCVKFSYDGNHIISGSWDQSIKIYSKYYKENKEEVFDLKASLYKKSDLLDLEKTSFIDYFNCSEKNLALIHQNKKKYEENKVEDKN